MSAEAFRKRVGRLIRSARDEAKLSQSDLVDRLGELMTKSLLSRYECGHVLPAIDRLKKLLSACKVPVVPPAIEAGYRQVTLESPSQLGQVFATEAAKEFIEAWLRIGTIDGVAEALGMHRNQVTWYVVRLRAKGVKLPRATHRQRTTPLKEDFGELRDFLASKLAEETPDVLQLPETKGVG